MNTRFLLIIICVVAVLPRKSLADNPVAGTQRFILSNREIEVIATSSMPSGADCYSLYLHYVFTNSSEKGLPWLVQAAYSNEPRAQYDYGLMLTKNSETMQLGLFWLNKAKENGYKPANDTLERLKKLAVPSHKKEN